MIQSLKWKKKNWKTVTKTHTFENQQQPFKIDLIFNIEPFRVFNFQMQFRTLDKMKQM